VPSKPSTVSVLVDDESPDLSFAFVKRVSSKLQVPVFASIPESFLASNMSQVESELLSVIDSFYKCFVNLKRVFSLLGKIGSDFPTVEVASVIGVYRLLGAFVVSEDDDCNRPVHFAALYVATG